MSDWDHTYDVVIVGSGIGGLVGALTAQAHGLEAVLVEKRDVVGGSSAMSGGVLWLPDNPLMERDGIPDSYDEAMAYFQAVVGDIGPASSEARRHAYVTLGPELVLFLERLGIGFLRCDGYSDYYDEVAGGSPRGRAIEASVWDGKQLGPWLPKLQPGLAETENTAFVALTGEVRYLSAGLHSVASLRAVMRIAARTIKGRMLRQKLLTNGASLIGQLLHAAVSQEIPIWTRSGLVDLVKEDGRIAGVVVGRAGREVRIQGRYGVLINGGGFAHNAEMRHRFGQQVDGAWTFANTGDTGEVIEIAMKYGAAVDLMDEAWWMPMMITPDGPWMVLLERHKPGAIIVDSLGRRFVNEASSYMEVGKAMFERELDGVSAVPSWLVFDHRNRSRYPLGKSLPRVTPKNWLETGFIKKANTIEGLAGQMEVDPAGLAETIARFNTFAGRREDPDFHRGERSYDCYYGDPTTEHPTLGPLARPPYYAIPLYPGDVGTSGGILTDQHGRVLQADGDPIPGLYASGNSTASVHGRFYLGAGASIGASAVYSYAALLHMVGQANGKGV
jgi:3-oxosteroid 1-dehydrogenase